MMASNKIDYCTWVDAIQIAMPVFARLGAIYKNSSYFNRIYNMYSYSKYQQEGNGLHNPSTGLWWRDKNFVHPYKEPNGKDCYWSRGNGWVIAASVKVLNFIPKNDPHCTEYLSDYKNMMNTIISLQRNDGAWSVSLYDPTHFEGKEITGTSLLLMECHGESTRTISTEKNFYHQL